MEKHFEYRFATDTIDAMYAAGLRESTTPSTYDTTSSADASTVYINGGYEIYERMAHCHRQLDETSAFPDRLGLRRFSKMDGLGRYWAVGIANHTAAIGSGYGTTVKTAKLSLSPRVQVHDATVSVDYTNATKTFSRASGSWDSTPSAGDWIYVQGFGESKANISHLVASATASTIVITTEIGTNCTGETDIKIYKTTGSETFGVTSAQNGNSTGATSMQTRQGFYQIAEGMPLRTHETHQGGYPRIWRDSGDSSSGNLGHSPEELGTADGGGYIKGHIARNMPAKFRIVPETGMNMAFLDIYVELLRN